MNSNDKNINKFLSAFRGVVDIAINKQVDVIAKKAKHNIEIQTMKPKTGWSPKQSSKGRIFGWGGTTFRNPGKRRSSIGEVPATQTGELVKKTTYKVKKSRHVSNLNYMVNVPYAKKLEEGKLNLIDGSKWVKKFKGFRTYTPKRSGKRPYMSVIIKNVREMYHDSRHDINKSIKDGLNKKGF